MPSLDTLISQWTDQLSATHPELVPHLGEIANYVRSSAQHRIDGGAAVEDAFASGLGSFGAPTDLSAEFYKNVTLRERKERMAVGSYLLITATFTGAVLLIDRRFDLGDQALAWLLVVWLVTTGLHGVLLRRARRGLVSD